MIIASTVICFCILCLIGFVCLLYVEDCDHSESDDLRAKCIALSLGAVVIIFWACSIAVLTAEPVESIVETTPITAVDGDYLRYSGKYSNNLHIYLTGADGVVEDRLVRDNYELITTDKEPYYERVAVEYRRGFLVFKEYKYKIYLRV